MRRLVLLVSILAACGADPRGGDTPDSKPDRTAPVTTANPASLTQLGALAVTLAANESAEIRWTRDGSDPRTSETATSGASPQVVALDAPAKVTLRFSAKDAAGNEEEPKSETYALLEDLQPASIAGRFIVHEALASGQGAVLLFGRDPAGPGGGGDPVRITTVSAGARGGAEYEFEGLPAGTYWVAAGWWPGAVQGDPKAFAFARQNPITLDPAVTEHARADFVDVYLGRCDPEGTGVEGEVVLAERYVDYDVSVGAFDGPIDFGGGSRAVGYAAAFGGGSRRAFAMCGYTAPAVWLLAAANPRGQRGDPEELATHHANPITAAGVTRVTMYLGETSPDLGSIAGRVLLSGPLAGAKIQVVVAKEPFTANTRIVGLTSFHTTNATEYAYSLTNLGGGIYHLLVAVETAEGRKAYLPHAQTVGLSLPGEKDPVVDLHVGVGGAQGTIEVVGGPAQIGRLGVAAYRAGTQQLVGGDQVEAGAPDTGGVRRAGYRVFGLADGVYDLLVVVDLDGDGDWGEDILAGRIAQGGKRRVTIEDGATVSEDFSVSLAAP